MENNMAAKHITPQQKVEALTLRSAGYTNAVISDMTAISVSSLKRLFKEYSVDKGKLKKDAVKEATDTLVHDANAIEHIKREVSALILDDIALVKRLRMAMAEAADKLIANDTTEALQVMRAVGSGAVALKSTSETLRKSLGMDKDSDISDDLPELTITVMTDDEIEEVKQMARERVAGVTDGLGDKLPEDGEVVEYFDEKEVHGLADTIA